MDMTVVMEIVPGTAMQLSQEQGRAAAESRRSSGGFARMFAEAVGGSEEPPESSSQGGGEIESEAFLFPIPGAVTAGADPEPSLVDECLEAVPLRRLDERAPRETGEMQRAFSVEALMQGTQPAPDSVGNMRLHQELSPGLKAGKSPERGPEPGAAPVVPRSVGDLLSLPGDRPASSTPPPLPTGDRGAGADTAGDFPPLSMLRQAAVTTLRPEGMKGVPAVPGPVTTPLREGAPGLAVPQLHREVCPPEASRSTGQRDGGTSDLPDHRTVRVSPPSPPGAGGSRSVAGDIPEGMLGISEVGLQEARSPVRREPVVTPLGYDRGVAETPEDSGICHPQEVVPGEGEETFPDHHLQLVEGNRLRADSGSVEGKSPERMTDSRSIADQIQRHLTLPPRREETRTITLQLHPEELGRVQVTISLERQTLEVEIVTESQAVRSAVMEHADQLRENLQRRNITVGSFEVSTRSGEFSQGMLNEQRNTAQPRHRSTLWAGRFDGGSVERVLDAAILPVRNPEYALLDVRF